MIDPLAITVDIKGRRWIRCARCAGNGEVMAPGDWKWPAVPPIKSIPCPECNGIGLIELP